MANGFAKALGQDNHKLVACEVFKKQAACRKDHCQTHAAQKQSN